MGKGAGFGRETGGGGLGPFWSSGAVFLEQVSLTPDTHSRNINTIVYTATT